MKTIHYYIIAFLAVLLLLFVPTSVQAQKRKVMNRPYIDQRLFHYGFLAGLHLQDIELEQNGFINEQKLWMPLLPEKLLLEELAGFRESSYRDGAWPQHKNGFRLMAPIGMVDDPENQMQFPLGIDLAEKGHLTVMGGVTSGKSTFLQSLVFSLISTFRSLAMRINLSA